MASEFTVDNIHCESCAKRVWTVVKAALPGADISVDVAASTVRITPDVPVELIAPVLEKAGYPLKKPA
jgi:copper chaperone CopZ